MLSNFGRKISAAGAAQVELYFDQSGWLPFGPSHGSSLRSQGVSLKAMLTRMMSALARAVRREASVFNSSRRASTLSMGWERFLTSTGWPVASKMAFAYRSTKTLQPGHTNELLIAIESPTTTRDQGVSDGMDVSVASGTGVVEGAA